MTIEQLLDYMYENHRIRRQKDIAKFLNVSTQAISNWKRSGKVPPKYALKIQVSKPTDYKELVETLTEVLISLNKNIIYLSYYKFPVSFFIWMEFIYENNLLL